MINKSKMKVSVFILGLMLAVGQGFAADCAANYVPPENTVWDGSTKTQPCTIGGFYIIDNAAKLAWYGANYNSGNAKLTADIDLGGKLWTPIAAGQGNAKYSKTFDGNGHVIKNMYINGTELAQKDKNYAQNLGFIGTLGNADSKKPGGKVKNLIFENVDIQASTNAGDILGRTDSQISVGVVVGWMAENDSNVVDNCIAASGTIRTTGTGQGVGGIVGNAKKGIISNCMSLVEIHTSGADAYIGGIIGITKTDVTVSSCVYAGPGLVNTGTNGLTGGVVGNVYTGTITTENNYFEGGGSAGVGGSICTQNCNKPPLDSASFKKANTNAQKVDETNANNVACALNGTNSDGTCKEEPYSVGLTGLSLNGYGADGYKIVFKANGGLFANGKNTANKFLQAGMTITADEVVSPSRENYSFAGWALTSDAAEVAENLGMVTGKDTIYAVWNPIYTITFNVAPGTFPSEGNPQTKIKQVVKGDVITVEGLGALPTARCKTYASENECKTWSYFTGWALTEGGGESDTVSLDTVIAEQGKILYAVWTDVETYTVTYNANHHGRTTVDYVRVGDGESVEEPDEPIADDGYEFVGWFTDEDGNNSYSFSAEIHANIILYAKWELKHFDITYVMNKVGSKGENPDKYTIDTAFVLKAPADVEGYVFEGWFYDASFTNKATQVIQGTTGDKTFYAKWSKKQYRIMYLADNSSQGAITDQFKEYGTPLTLESAGYFNRKGYAQTGWATVANGEKVYEFGANYEENAALTLYPSWSDPIVYTITYVCDGCINDPANKFEYTIETSTFSVKFKNLTPPDGYEMVGWYSATDYKNKVEQIKKGSFGDTTLYAKLNKIYKITYVGTDKPNSAMTYTVDKSVTLNTPADSAGYTFGGWFTNANFEGDAVTGIAKGSEGDTTFYAKWVPVPYTITYNIDGEPVELTPNTYTAASATELATPTRDGYEFDGWYSNVEYSGDKVTSIAAGSIGDTVFYAKWNKVYPFLVNGIGAIKFYEDENGNLTAEIDGEYTGEDEYSLDEEITVNSVVLNRSFVPYVPVTLTLPFDIAVENVENAKFYVFGGISVGENGKKAVEANRVKEGTLAANTPYMVVPTGTSILFNGSVTFRETVDPVTTVGTWQFCGTYSYKTVAAENVNSVYGISGSADGDIPQGSFVKFMAGSWFVPMRAYLLNTEVSNRRLARAYSAASVNNSRFEIIWNEGDEESVEEQTTSVRKPVVSSKVVNMRRVYDLKGRQVNGKTKVKGAYYNKKVVK